MIYECKLTAEDWQLYSTSMDCTPAVTGLNNALDNLIHDAFSEITQKHTISAQIIGQSVFDKMYPILEKYEKYGAVDSEPQYVLCDEIERAFNKHLDVEIIVSRF